MIFFKVTHCPFSSEPCAARSCMIIPRVPPSRRPGREGVYVAACHERCNALHLLSEVCALLRAILVFFFVCIFLIILSDSSCLIITLWLEVFLIWCCSIFNSCLQTNVPFLRQSRLKFWSYLLLSKAAWYFFMYLLIFSEASWWHAAL